MPGDAITTKLVHCSVLAVLFAVPTPPAAAQTFVEPSVNWLVMRAGSTSATPVAQGYGFGTGRLAKTVNLETQIIYFPKLVQSAEVAGSRAFFFSGGYVIGPEIRQHVRVYGAIGFGELYRKFSLFPSPDVEDSSIISNSITVDGGIGVVVRFVRQLGIRAEFRRGRAFNLHASESDVDESGPLSGFSLSHIDYWRVKLGFVAIFGAPPQSLRR